MAAVRGGAENRPKRRSARRVQAGKERTMLYWAVVFLIIAIIAAVFGFGGIVAGAVMIAKILFFVFLVLFVLSIIANFVRGPRRPPPA
jgi:uncharacterized membrane protein YtjA (UPF0391 family)